MRYVLAVACCLIAMGRLPGAEAAPARTQRVVSYHFKNVRVGAALERLAKDAGLRLVMDMGGTWRDLKITLHIRKIPWEQALKAVLAAAMREDSDVKLAYKIIDNHTIVVGLTGVY